MPFLFHQRDRQRITLDLAVVRDDLKMGDIRCAYDVGRGLDGVEFADLRGVSGRAEGKSLSIARKIIKHFNAAGVVVGVVKVITDGHFVA